MGPPASDRTLSAASQQSLVFGPGTCGMVVT